MTANEPTDIEDASRSTDDLAQFVDRHDATAIAERVRRGDIAPAELLDLAAARIEERNGPLNAIVESCVEQARQSLSDIHLDAPFAGIPFLIKDLGATVAGLRSTRGSRLWADNLATADSELVRRYRRAGFVIIGTTNTPEMGKNASTEPLLHGPTRNPHRLSHSPGGSSGGSAAAVAAGIVPMAHGNDGGGSIRIPASACGLVGLKPSRGRVTSAPSFNLLTYPLGVSHVMTRSVRDSARALDATAGPMPGDPYMIAEPATPWADMLDTPPGRLRIGLAREDRHGNPLHQDTLTAVLEVGALLEELGHDVTEAAPHWPNDAFAYIMRTVAGVATKLEVDERLAELDRALRDDDLEPFTRMLYDRAGTDGADALLKAFREIERAAREVGAFFVEHDLLLTGTLAEPTPPLGHLDTTNIEAMVQRAGRFSVLTSPFNVTGQPAISLPTSVDRSGMPLGTQLIGAFGREDLLLRVARQLELADPWSIRPVWPPVPA